MKNIADKSQWETTFNFCTFHKAPKNNQKKPQNKIFKKKETKRKKKRFSAPAGLLNR